MAGKPIMPNYEPEMYVRLRRSVEIDDLRIDEEIIHTPMLMLDAGEVVAWCLALRDEAASNLSLATAQAADRLRSEPYSPPTTTSDDPGRTKVRSEKQIESELPAFPTVKRARVALEDAKLDLALWQTLHDALRTKNSSLKVTAELIISGYITHDSIVQRRRASIRETGPAASTRRTSTKA